MALTKVRRDVLVGVLLVGGFLTWAGAMVTWDDPPQTPKHPRYVAACQLAGVLILFGASLTALPVASGAGSRRRAREPDPGPSPVGVRWHRVTLTQKHPAVGFRTPSSCPSCGDHEVGWSVSIAQRDRRSGAATLLGVAGLGVVGALIDHAREQPDDDVSVNVCDPCFRLDAARRTSRVVLGGAWISTSTVALVSLVFHPAWLWPTLATFAALGLAAWFAHRVRFRGRRARETALVGGVGVRASLAKASWFALSEGRVCWSLTVDACDPTWVLALLARNADGCEARADVAALEAHAAELRAAELR